MWSFECCTFYRTYFFQKAQEQENILVETLLHVWSRTRSVGEPSLWPWTLFRHLELQLFPITSELGLSD